MLPSGNVIPVTAFAPDLANLLTAIGWLAIVPVLVALGVLLIGIVNEERELAATRRRDAARPPTVVRRPARATRSAAA